LESRREQIDQALRIAVGHQTASTAVRLKRILRSLPYIDNSTITVVARTLAGAR
jgi:hypothetical protein